MRPFWTFQLFLAATSAIVLAGSGCGRSGITIHDGAAGAGAPASTGGVLGGSGGSGGSRSSAGTGTGGATSAGGSSGTTPGAQAASAEPRPGLQAEPGWEVPVESRPGVPAQLRSRAGTASGGAGGTVGVGGAGRTGGTAGVGGAGRTGGAAGAGGAGRTGGAGGSTRACNATSTAGCKAVLPEGCGDGINNQNGMEECDDGNALPGDGCNGTCKVEPHWTCPPAGPCMRNVVCGDSIIGAGEVCDDGNSLDNDGCNSTCTVQDPPTSVSPDTLRPHLPVWQQAHRSG